MKTITKVSVFAFTLSLFGCATDQQVKSFNEQAQFAVTCPVGFKPSTSYSTTFYSTDKEEQKKGPKSEVTTECVPEDLNKDAKMEWR